jgi:murein DD-endopeptidase MepM/ murein hydrolase activator NlpD
MRPSHGLCALAALVTLGACVPGRQPVTAAPAPVASPRVPGPLGPLTDVDRLSDEEYLRVRPLLVPVANVIAARIPDSFNEARGAGTHRAIDIVAPRGTPVLSADSGYVIRLRTNPAGGITIYAVDTRERFIYYYAHLERYRDSLAEGMKLARGDTIGYVGTTGNAPPDTPHLHFQVMKRGDGKRYWDGVPLDARPFLVNDEMKR